MCVETFIGLFMLGMAALCYIAQFITTRINWPMISYKMRGGK